MKLTFDAKGNEKQMEIWKLWNDSEHTQIAATGCKGFGKTYVALSIVLSMCLMYPNVRYFYCRSKLNDLRKFTLPDAINILENVWHLNNSYYTFNAQDNLFKFTNGSILYFIGADYLPSDPNYVRYGSIQTTGGVFEEAGSIPKDAYTNLCAAVGRWMNKEYGLLGKVLIISNPSNNWIFTDFYKPWKEGKLEPYKAFVLGTLKDNKQLPEEYYKNLERTLTENQKQRLLYGRFEFDDNPNLLVSFEAVNDCFTNTPSSGIRRISADIARSGRDKAVITSWNGTEATIESATNNTDSRYIENKIEEIASRLQIGRSQIVVDSDGLGAYLGDYIKGVVEFHNNGRALDVKYSNIKSQCAYKLAELINNRQLRINCLEEDKKHIIEELMMLIGKEGNDLSKLSLISKDEMKERIGHSSDYLDSLLMGMYGLIKQPSKGIRKISLGSI